ncbi:MAG: GDSL-type esterase/lipase family protein [Candidatus Omnitrophica bacterium]|nr:GDSL-type esterase/lipase family protein [Candidatus Omnitrophota bacterium]
MKKNKLKIAAFTAFFVILGFVVLNGCAKREIKNINSKGKNIICFGDSITFGYGVASGEDYPASLRKILSDTVVINAGVDGDTSVEGLNRINADVLEKNPRLVLIEFTGNDFLKKVPMENTIKNIRKMIEEIQRQGAMTAIVDVSAGLFLIEYRVRLFNLARQTNSIFIPEVLGGILTNPSMKSDFMHPNKNGYGIVAQRVYAGIKDYLK